jgi:hypothetical protein
LLAARIAAFIEKLDTPAPDFAALASGLAQAR